MFFLISPHLFFRGRHLVQALNSLNMVIMILQLYCQRRYIKNVALLRIGRKFNDKKCAPRKTNQGVHYLPTFPYVNLTTTSE